MKVHRAEVCADRARLEAVLHPDFEEVRRSGSRTTRAEVVAVLIDEADRPEMVAEDFQVTSIGDDAALLTYVSGPRVLGGDQAAEGLQRLVGRVIRTSLWARDSGAWTLRFRQETPVPDPVEDETRRAPGDAEPMERSLDLVSLVVRDYEEALAFFVGMLDFRLVEDREVPEQKKRWVVVAPPGGRGAHLLLARASTDEQAAHIGNQTGGRVFLFLSTDDFARDFERFRSRGVTFVREPQTFDYGTVAVFEDLYGNLWDLIEPA